jgi:hypothetical protein
VCGRAWHCSPQAVLCIPSSINDLCTISPPNHRSLEHSTILYESRDLAPLLRLSWNKQDPNYLATIHTDSHKAIIIDIRCVGRLISLVVCTLGE